MAGEAGPLDGFGGEEQGWSGARRRVREAGLGPGKVIRTVVQRVSLGGALSVQIQMQTQIVCGLCGAEVTRLDEIV